MSDESQSNAPVEPPEDSSVPKRGHSRRRRWAFGLMSAVFALIIVLFAALWFLPSILRPAWLDQQLEENLSALLGAPLRIDRLDYHPFWGVRLDGIELGAPEGYSKPVFSAETLELRYALGGLWRRELVVERVALIRPHVALESVSGVSNLDAILAKLASPATEPEPEPEPEPASGPLSPIRIELKELLIEDASFEMSGGQYVKLSGVSLGLSAALDSEALDAHLKLSAKSEAEPNLELSLPEPPIDLSAKLGFTMTATVAGASARGLALDETGLEVVLGLRELLIKNRSSAPPINADFHMRFMVSPSHDKAALDRLALRFQGESILGAELELDGLAAALEQTMGPGSAQALGAAIGIRRGKGRGLAKLSVSAIRVPIDTLQPYLTAMNPKLSAGGTVSLGPLRVEGTLAELMSSSPSSLDARLHFDSVRGRDAELDAELEPLSGDLRFFLEPSREARPYRLAGKLAIDAARFGSQAVGATTIELDGGLDRLSYPSLGTVAVGVGLKTRAIRAAPASVARLGLRVELEGDEPFSSTRPQTPVLTRIALDATGLSVATGTSAVSVDQLGVDIETEIDRLLEPALKPIVTRVRAHIGAVELAAQKIDAHRINARIDLSADDPRSGRPIEAKAQIGLDLGQLVASPAVLESSKIELGLTASGIDPMPPSGRSPEVMPTSVQADLRVSLPKIYVQDPSLGRIATKLALRSSVRAQPRVGAASIQRFELELDDLLRASLRGSVRRLLTAAPWLDLRLDVAPVDLAKSVAKVPPKLLEGNEGLEGKGTIALTGTFKGPVPSDGALVQDLTKPPFDASLDLRLDGVDLIVPSQGAHVKGVGGKLRVDVRKGRVWADSALRLVELARADHAASVVASDIELNLGAGLEEQVWRVDAGARVRSLEVPGQVSGAIEGARVDLSLLHPLYGDLLLRRLSIQAPGAGLVADIEGGLERRSYGAVRPVFSLRSSVDFDRLRAVVPSLPEVSGKLGFELGIASPNDRDLDIAGTVSLTGVGYRLEQAGPPPLLLTAKNINGRLPFSQRVLLPFPKPIELGETSAGILGDDLEARLQDLIDDASKRPQIFVACGNVLVDDPRTADYEALRPYRKRSGARLTIEEIGYNEQSIENLAMDALYDSGVFRIDRFALQVFEGDIFGSLALQVPSRDNVRVRLRSILTDLNLDVPFSRAVGQKPASGRWREPYLVSGTTDLQFDLKKRAVSGSMDITKMGGEMFVRIVDAIDPHKENAKLQETRGSIANLSGFWVRDFIGIALKGIKVDIKQNLMNLEFDWYHPWFDIHASSEGGVRWLPRIWLPVTQLLAGTPIIEAIPDLRRFGLTDYLDQALVGKDDMIARSVPFPIVTGECKSEADSLSSRSILE